MKVSFDVTMEDHVDIELRSNPPNRADTFWLIFNIVATAAVGITLSYLLFSSIIGGIIVSAIWIGLNLYMRRGARERIIRDDITSLYAPQWPVRVDVEVNESGIYFEEFGMTIGMDWDIVESAHEEGDAIYFTNIYGEVSAVRTRAFATDAEKQQFISLIPRYSVNGARDIDL